MVLYILFCANINYCLFSYLKLTVLGHFIKSRRPKSITTSFNMLWLDSNLFWEFNQNIQKFYETKTRYSTSIFFDKWNLKSDGTLVSFRGWEFMKRYFQGHLKFSIQFCEFCIKTAEIWRWVIPEPYQIRINKDAKICLHVKVIIVISFIGVVQFTK